MSIENPDLTYFLPVEAVANFFIKKGIGKEEPLTQLQIQKLIYISHGWFLALHDKNLIDEDFEAWQYGPVVKSLYDELKSYKSNPITKPIVRHSVQYLGNIPYYGYNEPSVPEGVEKSHLEQVWEIHKGLSGFQLVNITHQENSPWFITYVTLNQYKGRIPNELTKQYYKNLMVINN